MQRESVTDVYPKLAEAAQPAIFDSDRSLTSHDQAGKPLRDPVRAGDNQKLSQKTRRELCIDCNNCDLIELSRSQFLQAALSPKP